MASNGLEEQITDYIDELPEWAKREGVGVLIVVIVAIGYWGGVVDWIVGSRNVWGPMLTGLGGVGTIILAILYWRQQDVLEQQATTQSKQAEIMAQQEDLMEAEIRPLLQISRIDVCQEEKEIEELTFFIRNEGSGKAINCQLRCEVIAIRDGDQIPIQELTEGIEPKGAPIWQKRKSDENISGTSGAVIDPGSYDEFVAGIWFTDWTSDSMGTRLMGLDDVIAALDSQGVTETIIRFVVFYQDLRGKTYKETFLSVRLEDVSEDITLFDILNGEDSFRIPSFSLEDDVTAASQ